MNPVEEVLRPDNGTRSGENERGPKEKQGSKEQTLTGGTRWWLAVLECRR